MYQPRRYSLIQRSPIRARGPICCRSSSSVIAGIQFRVYVAPKDSSRDCSSDARPRKCKWHPSYSFWNQPNKVNIGDQDFDWKTSVNKFKKNFWYKACTTTLHALFVNIMNLLETFMLQGCFNCHGRCFQQMDVLSRLSLVASSHQRQIHRCKPMKMRIRRFLVHLYLWRKEVHILPHLIFC
jgi:hypothetical protein